jgi:hypothetical protein
MRGIHPSYLGAVDISVVGNSDPGVSSIVTPFCETDGLFFNSENEPEDFKREFEFELFNYTKSLDDGDYVDIIDGDFSKIKLASKEVYDKSVITTQEVPNSKYEYVKYINYREEEDD